MSRSSLPHLKNLELCTSYGDAVGARGTKIKKISEIIKQNHKDEVGAENVLNVK